MEKYQGRLVALVGVNSDSDRDAARQILQRERISWPNFWVEDPEHGVHQQYHVRSWPTTYVLDGQGIVRFQTRDHEEIDRAVQSLLGELEAKGPDG